MIGILIALQVNSLNEQRKDRLLEKSYYQSLIVDLTRDSLDFVFRDMVARGNIRKMENIIRFIESGYDPGMKDFLPVVPRRSWQKE